MKMIIIVAAALVLITVFIFIGVRAANKEARENGTEKSYTVWSVISGFVIGFFVLLYEICKEVFFPSRRRRY